MHTYLVFWPVAYPDSPVVLNVAYEAHVKLTGVKHKHICIVKAYDVDEALYKAKQLVSTPLIMPTV